jgi:hypothetical protein
MGSYVKLKGNLFGVNLKINNIEFRVQIVVPYTTFPRNAVPKNNLKFIGPGHFTHLLGPIRLPLPGGTAGYPAHPRLIRLSVCPSVTYDLIILRKIAPGPTDLVKYCLKIQN